MKKKQGSVTERLTLKSKVGDLIKIAHQKSIRPRNDAPQLTTYEDHLSSTINKSLSPERNNSHELVDKSVLEKFGIMKNRAFRQRFNDEF
jgi:hypothetical protein